MDNSSGIDNVTGADSSAEEPDPPQRRTHDPATPNVPYRSDGS